METIEIGTSGLTASRIALGTWAIGGWMWGGASDLDAAIGTVTGDDLRRKDPKFQEPRFSQYLAAVSALDRHARVRHGRGVLALAVRWVLDQGETIALWGARRPAQRNPVEDALGLQIDARSKRAIDEILRQTVKDPVGPEFMAPPSRSDTALAA